jgi:hypothetical protein
MAERFAAKNLGEQTSFDFDFMQERASAGQHRSGFRASAFFNTYYICELDKVGRRCGMAAEMMDIDDVDLSQDHADLSQNSRSEASETALAFIEQSLERVCHEMQQGEASNPAIYLRRLDRYDVVSSQNLVGNEHRAKDHAVKYSWPGKTAGEAWRFGLLSSLDISEPTDLNQACALAVLNSVHAAISSGNGVTKR